MRGEHDLKERVKNQKIWKAERSKGEQARDKLKKENEVFKQENGSLKNELKKSRFDYMMAEKAIYELKKENEIFKQENGSLKNEFVIATKFVDGMTLILSYFLF